MPDNGMDGDPQGSGTASGANPGTSTPPEGQPSPSEGQLQETLNALAQGMETLSKRIDGLQGKKDKEISSLRSQLTEYEKLKEKLGPDGAADQLELRQTLQDMQAKITQLSVPTPQTGGTEQGTAVDPKQVISDFGYDPSDPAMAPIASKSYKTEAEVMAALRAHAKATRSQPVPTPAQQAAIPSQPTRDPGMVVQQQNYANEMIAARGNGPALRAIKKKYRDLGVPVDSLVIT